MNAPTKAQQDLDRLLTPEDLLDPEPDPLAGTPEGMTPAELRGIDDPAKGLDALVPDDLREKPEDPNLEADPLGLVPDAYRVKPDDDPLGYPGDVDELPAKVEAAAVQTPVVEGVKTSLGEWAEKWGKDQAEKIESEKFERETERRKVEDENLEIKESLMRAFSKRKAEDLTPDELK